MRRSSFERLLCAGFICCSVAFASGQSRSITSSVPPAQDHRHRATLQWTPSPESRKPHQKIEYLIYKADGKKRKDGSVLCSSTFKKISQVDGSTASFTDWEVKANRIYCYKVTSLSGKHESPATDVVTAIIPPDKKP